MTRLPIQNITVAGGMDTTNDPVTMSLDRARRIVNMLIDKNGLVGAQVRLVNQLPAPAAFPIDGNAWYYGATIKNSPFLPDTTHTDLLVWSAGSFLFIAKPAGDPLTQKATGVRLYPNGITGYTNFGPFFAGRHIRFFALSDELFMVQEGGLLPIRFWASLAHGEGFARAGIETPIADGSGNANLSLTAVSTGLTGTWGYRLTFADERFRESSPSETLDIALVNQGTRATIDNIGVYNAPTTYGGSVIRYAYLYRNTIAAPDAYYQIAARTLTLVGDSPSFPQNFGAGDFFANANAYDNAADADIVTGAICPGIGENDPPLAASIGVVHKNRVFYNAVDQPNTLQISNEGSPVQFSVLFNPDKPTTGGRLEIGSDQGNIITAFVEFGSVLAIFKRRGSYFLYGDSLSDFIVRPVHQRGCIAPDSAVRCDNVVLFLSDDGVYAASYEGGEVVQKVSKEIEEQIVTAPISELENSRGWFVNNRYHLSVGATIFVYDFDSGPPNGWTSFVFGSGPVDLGAPIPTFYATANVGFGDIGNSSLYGSIVPCGDGAGVDDGLPCSVTATPTDLVFTGAGGTLSLTVTPDNSTQTPYSSQSLWLGINGPQFGPGTATVSCEPNPTCFDRFGTVMVCQQVISVTQARSSDTTLCPCMMTSLTPQTFNVDHAAQTVQTAYVETSSATITETSFDGWLHPHAPVVGTPTTGTIDIDVDANTTCQDRTGMVQICDMIVTVNQAADPGCGCNVTINPTEFHTFPGDVGSFMFTVTNLTNGTYPCTTDVVWITDIGCPGGLGAGTWACGFNYDGTQAVPITDGVGHITLCNAVFTIIFDQHS